MASYEWEYDHSGCDTYALWSGVGIALVTAFGWLYYRQALDAPTLCGLALIAAGIVLIQLRGGH